MPKVDFARESEIKRKVRIAIAKDPMISMPRLQAELQKQGITSANGTFVDRKFLAKMVRKISEEQRRHLDADRVEDRILETRERFNLVTQRLMKIAFWEFDYLREGIPMPTAGEQIAALNSIMKLDLALLSAEMDAGIFRRELGEVGVLHRAVPLPAEKKEEIMRTFAAWGIGPKQIEARFVESKESNGDTGTTNANSTPASGGSVVVEGS